MKKMNNEIDNFYNTLLKQVFSYAHLAMKDFVENIVGFNFRSEAKFFSINRDLIFHRKI